MCLIRRGDGSTLANHDPGSSNRKRRNAKRKRRQVEAELEVASGELVAAPAAVSAMTTNNEDDGYLSPNPNSMLKLRARNSKRLNQKHKKH